MHKTDGEEVRSVATLNAAHTRLEDEKLAEGTRSLGEARNQKSRDKVIPTLPCNLFSLLTPQQTGIKLKIILTEGNCISTSKINFSNLWNNPM